MTTLFLLLFPALLMAADWNTGTGGNPQRNGKTPEYGPENADIWWEGGLPSDFAQPVVIEGNVAVMSRTSDIADPLHGTLIVAHSLANGDILWSTELPIDFPTSDWRSRVCAIRDGKVYASRSGNTNYSFVYALDATSGNIVWQSEDSLDESSTESPSFAPNGDLIVGGFHFLERIDATDGSQVWRTNRTSPTSGGSEAVVFANRVYIWEAGANGPVVTAFNLDTGARLYSSRGIGGGFIQQVGLFVGSDGIVYAPRSQNNPVTDSLVALEDDGASLVERWRVPLGFVPFATFAEGPDGSIYSYSREYRVLRINPDTGIFSDSSDIFGSDFYQPRMAVDARGTVFLTNGGFTQGRLYAFPADLGTYWSHDIPGVNISGPAIGDGGMMVTTGTGTNVITFRGTTPDAVGRAPSGLVTSAMLTQNYPNPFNYATTIGYELAKSEYVTLTVLNSLGQHVATLINGRMASGYHTAQFDGTGLASGAYYCQLQAGNKTESLGMILLK